MGISIKELFENPQSRKQIPTESGVYIVKVPSGMTVKLKKNRMGFK